LEDVFPFQIGGFSGSMLIFRFHGIHVGFESAEIRERASPQMETFELRMR